MTDATDAAEPGVTLTCQPGREGEVLVFPYTVINNSGGDIYVLDAVPELDPESGAPRVNLNTAVVARGEDGFAHILRGIAPLPRDRSVAMRVIPLGTRVPQGGTLERRFTLNEPLHETGPYHPDLPLSRYRLRDIKGVILTVHYLPASAEGFGAAPVDYAAEVFRVFSKNTIGDTRAVSCQMPARGLNILVRTDDFPRP